jgi:cytochrome c-type biogenesis protein
MALGGLLFVLGFSFVFISFSAFVGAVGEWMFEYQRQITVGLGVVTILVGLAFMGVVPWFQRDFRVHRVPAVGLAAAPLLGVLFGLGWTPCIGPTLTAVLGLATHEATAGRGALLGFAYCLGLGVPFILAASRGATCSAPSRGSAGTRPGSPAPAACCWSWSGCSW